MRLKNLEERRKNLSDTELLNVLIPLEKLSINDWFIQEARIVHQKNWLIERHQQNIGLS
ncbi:hypothetical protein [Nostoc sp.]|uniref:hypothetical protein n=1 Tax=Nostoc sp. TaxID=1180 RepID=UPI002FF9BB61